MCFSARANAGVVERANSAEGKGFYDNYGEMAFGLMFHGFDYLDETKLASFGGAFWRAR